MKFHGSFICMLSIAMLLSPATSKADDFAWIQRVLRFQKVQGSNEHIRNFATEALKKPSQLRYSINSENDYIIATEHAVLTNNGFFPVELGGDLKTAINNRGDWLASGKNSSIFNGNIFTDPGRVRALHHDMTIFRHTSFRPAGSLWRPIQTGAGVNSKRAGPVASASTAAANTDSTTLRHSESIRLVLDTTPPRVEKIEIITQPGEENKIRIQQPPRVFIGAGEIHIRIRMSEKMLAPPVVTVNQSTGSGRTAALLVDSNPLFTYTFYPDTSAAANGPAGIKVTGNDLAGNEITADDPSSNISSAIIVDTLAPDLLRVDTSQPGIFNTRPRDGSTIAGDAFPKVIQVFIMDYNQADDGGFSGENTDTSQASGVDWRLINHSTGKLSIHLYTPSGKEIHGTMTVRKPALELLLPDVYVPGTGIFPDTDSDGTADPEEGTYRVELTMTDKVGNSNTLTMAFGVDTTPVQVLSLQVSIKPVLADPITNPVNPIPENGTAVKRLDSIEITSGDSDFDFVRSNAKLLSYVAGRHLLPDPVKTKLTRQDDKLILTVLRDQDGDGQDDFENPAAGQYLPPGMVDPRWGKNDGHYVIEIEAVDHSGNKSTIRRELVLDTTSPETADTFPGKDVTINAPLRMVDAIIKDPRAASGALGSGIDLEHSNIRLIFEGNDSVPSQTINGVAYIHAPNSNDPTQPGFNPNDKYPKLLFEILDSSGQVTSLPEDGSWDGRYRLELLAIDKAGNQVQGTAGFTYSAQASEASTEALTMVFP